MQALDLYVLTTKRAVACWRSASFSVGNIFYLRSRIINLKFVSWKKSTQHGCFTYRSMACMHWIGGSDKVTNFFFIGDPKITLVAYTPNHNQLTDSIILQDRKPQLFQLAKTSGHRFRSCTYRAMVSILEVRCCTIVVGRGPTSASPADAEVGPRPTSTIAGCRDGISHTRRGGLLGSVGDSLWLLHQTNLPPLPTKV